MKRADVLTQHTIQNKTPLKQHGEHATVNKRIGDITAVTRENTNINNSIILNDGRANKPSDIME